MGAEKLKNPRLYSVVLPLIDPRSTSQLSILPNKEHLIR